MAQATDPSVGHAKDVVVFVSGLGTRDLLQAEHIANVMACEMRKRDPDPVARFSVVSALAPTDSSRTGSRPSVHRLVRHDSAGGVPVFDLYHISPRAVLSVPAADEQPLRRVLRVLPVAIGGVIVLVGAFFSDRGRAKSLSNRVQLLAVFLMLLAVVAYLVTALWALATAVAAVIREDETASLTTPQWIVLVGAVLVALFPSWRTALAEAAEITITMFRHVWAAPDRNVAAGFLQQELDDVAAAPEVERVHVVAYSFGSLMAIDALYPSSSSNPPQLHKISSLTTIGCPFDMIRMLHGSYAGPRSAVAAPNWLNIYAPQDLLGSDFRDVQTLLWPRGDVAAHGLQVDTGERLPDVSLAWNPNDRVSVVGLLMLVGLSSHVSYWNDEPTAESALGIFTERFLASPLLLTRGNARQEALADSGPPASNGASGGASYASEGAEAPGEDL